MIRRSHCKFPGGRLLGWLVLPLGLCCAPAAPRDALPTVAAEEVDRQRVILDLALPADATATIDGHSRAPRGRLLSQPLKPEQWYRSTLRVQYADGRSLARELLFHGGWLIHVPLWTPSPSQPDLVFPPGRVLIPSAAAASPDGRQLAVGTIDGSLCVWDLASNHGPRIWPAHASCVRCVAYSSDGRRLASGSNDKTAAVWDLPQGTRVETLRGHAWSVTAVLFRPDGRQLLTAAEDRTAVWWNVEQGTALGQIATGNHAVASAAIDPRGRQLLLGCWDAAMLDDPSAAVPRRTLRGHRGPITSVAITPDGQQVVTGSEDRTAIVWDARKGKIDATLAGHHTCVEAVACSPDGRQVLTGSSDGRLLLWDLRAGSLLRTFAGHCDCVTSVGFAAAGRLAFSASRDGSVRLWDIPTGDELARLAALGEDGWVVATPEGLFDGTPAQRRDLHFRYPTGGDDVPLDRAPREACRAGLLAALVRGERPMPASVVGKPPPTVQTVDLQPSTLVNSSPVPPNKEGP